MDAAAVVAIGLVALAVVIAGAAWRHRRGGLHLDVRLWWDTDDDGGDSGPDDAGGR